MSSSASPCGRAARAPCGRSSRTTGASASRPRGTSDSPDPRPVRPHGSAEEVRVAQDAVARNDELIDRELLRKRLPWGIFWLGFAPTVGVMVSTKFNYPDFLGDQAWLTFGRLRPVHVNGVIWGAFSTLFIGLCYYVTPRLAGIPVCGARWGHVLVWVWNLNLAVAFVGLSAVGTNRGWEVGELPLPHVLILMAAVLGVSAQLLMTIARRVRRPLYVSLWYLIGALVWTDVNLVLLAIGPHGTVPGINNAA